MLDPKATIVTFADTSNVDSVFVAGNAVKRNGQLVGVDMKSVVQKLEESRNHILGQGGLLPDWAAETQAARLALMARTGASSSSAGRRVSAARSRSSTRTRAGTS